MLLVDVPAAQMQHVDEAAHSLGEAHAVIQRPSARDEQAVLVALFAGDMRFDDKALAACLLNGRARFRNQAQAVLETAAVLVGALVDKR